MCNNLVCTKIKGFTVPCIINICFPMPQQTFHLLHLKQQCLLCGKEASDRRKRGSNIPTCERRLLRLLPSSCRAEPEIGVCDGRDATGPVWQLVPERAPKVSDSTCTKSWRHKQGSLQSRGQRGPKAAATAPGMTLFSPTAKQGEILAKC